MFGHKTTTVKYPFLIECPFTGLVPTSVSLVEFPCDNATNNLKILNILPVDGIKKRFGICSKQAKFENRDFAIRFIEWVHMLRVLGAEKVHFPYDVVHPDIMKVINYFEEKGFVEAWKYLNPAAFTGTNVTGWQRRQLQVIVQTDCFYKVKNLYDFVAFLDMDEVIIPTMDEDLTWEDMLKRTNLSDPKDAYISRNLYYPEVGAKAIEGIPSFMYMLQHVERSVNYSRPGAAVKSLFNTETVLAVHTHYPHFCFNKDPKRFKCNHENLPTNISQSSHYRDHMDPGTTYNVTREDKTIWKYKERLIEAVLETLRDLEFVP